MWILKKIMLPDITNSTLLSNINAYALIAYYNGQRKVLLIIKPFMICFVEKCHFNRKI